MIESSKLTSFNQDGQGWLLRLVPDKFSLQFNLCLSFCDKATADLEFSNNIKRIEYYFVISCDIFSQIQIRRPTVVGLYFLKELQNYKYINYFVKSHTLYFSMNFFNNKKSEDFGKYTN